MSIKYFKKCKKLLPCLIVFIILSYFCLNNQSGIAEPKSLITESSNLSVSPSSSPVPIVQLDPVIRSDLCETEGPWTVLSDYLFFKKGAAFYFLDANFFRLHFISSVAAKDEISSKLNLDLEINDLQRNKILKHSIPVSYSYITWVVESSQVGFIQADFNLTKLSIEKELDLFKLKLSLRVSSKLTKQMTDQSISVIIKNMRSNYDMKKSALICSKCVYLKSENDFKNFETWLELNKRNGYDQVIVCNQSIDDTAQFQRIFKKFSSFLKMKQLNCLPNLESENKLKTKYLTDFKGLRKNGEFFIYKFDIINQLVLNECYLDNIEKYKYIAIFDIDETVVSYLPSWQTNEKNQVEILRSCPKIDTILNFLLGIKESMKLDNKKPRSLYFSQGYFLKNRIANKIFDQIDLMVRKWNGNILTVEVKDSDPKVEEEHYPSDYIFTISSPDELKYAKRLSDINKRIIQPFLRSNSTRIQKFIQNYDRFFVISGDVNDFSWGKSIHDTRKTFDLTLHHPNNFILEDKNEVQWDSLFLYKQNAQYAAVPYDTAYLSHFRNYFHWKFQRMPITALRVDLNYLYCNFLPILNKLSNEQAN